MEPDDSWLLDMLTHAREACERVAGIEREQFLAHCQPQGTSHKALHNMAPELIAVIRLIRLEKLREVSLEEIKQAAEVWAGEQRSNPRAELREVRQLLYLRCEEMVALPRKVEDSVSATCTLC